MKRKKKAATRKKRKRKPLNDTIVVDIDVGTYRWLTVQASHKKKQLLILGSHVAGYKTQIWPQLPGPTYDEDDGDDV